MLVLDKITGFQAHQLVAVEAVASSATIQALAYSDMIFVS